MRQKKWCLIISFHTTAGAMAWEKLCMAENAPGRMIPVPREISAGCGLAWCAAVNDRDRLESLIKKKHVDYQEITELYY